MSRRPERSDTRAKSREKKNSDFIEEMTRHLPEKKASWVEKETLAIADAFGVYPVNRIEELGQILLRVEERGIREAIRIAKRWDGGAIPEDAPGIITETSAMEYLLKKKRGKTK